MPMLHWKPYPRPHTWLLVILLPSILAVLLLGSHALWAASAPEPALWNQAQKEFTEKNYNRARALYRQLAKAYPKSPRRAEALVQAGRCGFSLKNWQDYRAALEDFQMVSRDYPGTLWAARSDRAIGNLLAITARHDPEMHKAYERAIRYFAGDKKYLSEQAQTLLDQASAYLRRWDEREKALANYERVLKLNPPPTLKARTLFLMGEFYFRVGLSTLKPEDNRIRTLELWQSLQHQFPKDPLAADAQYRIARQFDGGDTFVRAIEEFDRLIKHYPKSQWAPAARYWIERIRETHLRIQIPRVYLPGDEFKIRVDSRNIRTVAFSAYRIDLLALTRQLRNEESWRSYRPVESSKTASWTFDTRDAGRHLYFSGEAPAPLIQPGAYVIVAEAGGKRAHVLAIVSNLAMVVKHGPGGSLIYCTQADSGRPVGEATVDLRGSLWSEGSKTQTGSTDKDGLIFLKELVSDHQVYAVAKWKDHYALSPAYYSYYSGQEERLNVYGYTDRPVYRPGQKVYYKAILRQMKEGEYQPVSQASATVTIHDPRGNEIDKKELQTSSLGTLHGELPLGEKPVLGLYQVQVSTGEGGYSDTGSFQFRVEEYKKPEFSVSVNTDKPTFVLGDMVKAVIKAKYYFGEPVVKGNVQYTVTKHWWLRSYWWYERPDRWRGLYPPDSMSGQRVVLQSTGTTDGEGQLGISFPTEEEPFGPDYEPFKEDVQYRYTVQVAVVDKSRREIKETRHLMVGRTAFTLGLTPERFVYTPGDRVRVRIQAASLNEEPVKTRVEVTAARIEWRGDKEQVQSRLTTAVATDERGEAVFEWTPELAGYYRVEARARDERERLVTGVATTWIADPGYAGGFYRYRGLEIVTDKKEYLPGEKARVVINSEFADSWTLLTTEATGVYRYQVLAMGRAGGNLGATRVIDLPIEDRYAPNVFLTLSVVRGGKFYQHQVEIPVKPARNLLQVSVKFLKDRFRPREKSVLEVTTTDPWGHPVAAEVSLGVTDASVYYIQQELAPDIQAYYYGEKRENQVNTASSFDFSQEGHTVDLEPKPPTQYQPPPDPSFLGHWGGMFATADGSGMEEGEGFAVPASPEKAPGAMKRRARNGGGEGKKDEMVEPEVREYFPDTMFWNPVIATGSDGQARIEVQFPDSLTTWRATARALAPLTRVGSTVQEVVTAKDLLVRLQAPRFFTERDQLFVSGIVHNYLPQQQSVKMRLKLDGLTLLDPPERTVTVASKGEYRVDWRVKAEKAGKAVITLAGLTVVESDAMKMEFPVLPHGVEKFLARSGRVDRAIEARLTVPAERRKETTHLQILLSPTLAATMLDALPYLASYPYGCVEQTMSRFLPSVIVAKTLNDLGVALPPGSKLTREELDKMVAAGLQRLYGFQHGDGGWGWWKDDQTNDYMTAYVVFGMSQAQWAGYEVDTSVVDRGRFFLSEHVAAIRNVNLQAYMLYALSQNKQTVKKALDRVYRDRDDLTDYGRALLALTLHHLGDKKRAEILGRNLWDRAKEREGSWFWGELDGYYYWYHDGVEATAYALKALAAVDPQNPKLEEVARWLIMNRRGGRWKSTKDTASVVYAITDYVRVHRDLNPDYTARILLNGKPFQAVEVNAGNVLTFERNFLVPPELIRDGENVVRVEKQGEGTLYYSAFLTFYTFEEEVKGAGNEVFVRRELFRVVPKLVAGQQEEERVPLTGPVRSGDQLEVRLTIHSKNDFEYMMFEDPKPAGAEPVELRSGYTWGGGIGASMELRDTMITFFSSWLPRGTHTLTYRLRAEIPGDFHMMPTQASCMYVPEVRGLADEQRVVIRELETGNP